MEWFPNRNVGAVKAVAKREEEETKRRKSLPPRIPPAPLPPRVLAYFELLLDCSLETEAGTVDALAGDIVEVYGGAIVAVRPRSAYPEGWKFTRAIHPDHWLRVQ